MSAATAAWDSSLSSQPVAGDRQGFAVPSLLNSQACCKLFIDPGVSVVKSAEIATRGTRVFAAAIFALVATVTDEVFTQQRSRLSCRSLTALLHLEQDDALRGIAENTRRVGIIAVIAQQLSAEATYPVQRQLSRTLDNLGLSDAA